jgi:hypothetical protein
MEVIYTTLVGSKMHGLSTPTSDEDVRHITMNPIRHILSPFRNEEIKVKDSSGDDVESWELCHFVKHLSQGNPTTYEVIKSPLYDNSLRHSKDIRSLMPFCFDGRKVLMAHIGYAEAQLKRYLRKADHDLSNDYDNHKVDDTLLLGTPKWENKNGGWVEEGVWEENNIRRVPKSVVAAYRVLAQGRQLLDTGDFEPVVKSYSPELHDKLMSIKTMDANTISYSFVIKHLNGIESEIKDLKAHFETLPDSVKFAKPNIDKIEDVLCEVYGV